MSIFSNRLKDLRKDRRLTQKQLASKLFIDDTSISKYENDKAMPENELLQRIADFFEVSVDYLLGRDTTFNNLKAPYQKDLFAGPSKPVKSELNKKEKINIEKEAQKMIDNLDNADVVEFCGTPADEEDKEFLKMAYERFLSDVRVYNKTKYTPKKYRDR
jgi:transcriptional regulator with XRE-family HTH domain